MLDLLGGKLVPDAGRGKDDGGEDGERPGSAPREFVSIVWWYADITCFPRLVLRIPLRLIPANAVPFFAGEPSRSLVLLSTFPGAIDPTFHPLFACALRRTPLGRCLVWTNLSHQHPEHAKRVCLLKKLHKMIAVYVQPENNSFQGRTVVYHTR